MLIREASIADTSSLHLLTNQLGYEIKSSRFKKQLEFILNSKTDILLLAVNLQNTIGYLHAIEASRLTTDTFTEIVALVVDEKERNNGIGSALLNALQSISNTKEIRVRCNRNRKAAHNFYKKHNFNVNKEQTVFSLFIS